MTDKPMTPSEIADWLDDRAMTLGTSTIAYQQAAATIRELEARDAKRIKAHQETLDRERVALTKLKIATEALEHIEGGSSYSVGALAFCAAETALARIEEVGL